MRHRRSESLQCAWPARPLSLVCGLLACGILVSAGVHPDPITIPQLEGYQCEEPYSQDVKFHIIITSLSRASYKALQYMGLIGLTNAEIFVYLRSDPGDAHQTQINLPCGMRFHEKLLLPNQGDEAAAIFTHIAYHYDNLPDAVMVLHGGPLHSWHSLCSVAVRRMRAFYRGLGTGPKATPTMREFAQRVQTLNSCRQHHGVEKDTCCGSLFCRAAGSDDGTTCPWELVGTAWGIDMEGQKVSQPLCQLKDRTPSSNWTVLGSDVPDFFINREEILRKYETDPWHRVPITHHPRVTDSATATERRRLTQLQHLPRLLQPLTGRKLKESAVWQPSEHAKQLHHESSQAWQARDTGSTTNSESHNARAFDSHHRNNSALQPLTNAKDELFPNNRASDLVPLQDGRQMDPGTNGRIYDPQRFWSLILRAHGIQGDYRMADHDKGEWDHSWCCLQFIAPRHVLQRNPKGWWEDVAFLLTHIAWQDSSKWPKLMGMMVEWHFWLAIGQRFNTLETNSVFVKVDREMGEDKQLAQCHNHISLDWEPPI